MGEKSSNTLTLSEDEEAVLMGRCSIKAKTVIPSVIVANEHLLVNEKNIFLRALYSVRD